MTIEKFKVLGKSKVERNLKDAVDENLLGILWWNVADITIGSIGKLQTINIKEGSTYFTFQTLIHNPSKLKILESIPIAKILIPKVSIFAQLENTEKTKFTIEENRITLPIPTKHYFLDRRHSQRVIFNEESANRAFLNFGAKNAGSSLGIKEINDLSTGGLSLAVSKKEVMFYKIGDQFRNVQLVVSGFNFAADITIVHVHENPPRKGPAFLEKQFKIGLRIDKLHGTDVESTFEELVHGLLLRSK